MPIAGRLGHRDYDAALALIADAADTSGAQPFEFPAIERLLRVIPAESAGYFEYQGGGVGCAEPSTPNSWWRLGAACGVWVWRVGRSFRLLRRHARASRLVFCSGDIPER